MPWQRGSVGKNAIGSIRWPILENPPIDAKILQISLTQADEGEGNGEGKWGRERVRGKGKGKGRTRRRRRKRGREGEMEEEGEEKGCLLYTSPSPRDRQKSRMPSSA